MQIVKIINQKYSVKTTNATINRSKVISESVPYGEFTDQNGRVDDPLCGRRMGESTFHWRLQYFEERQNTKNFWIWEKMQKQV